MAISLRTAGIPSTRRAHVRRAASCCAKKPDQVRSSPMYRTEAVNPCGCVFTRTVHPAFTDWQCLIGWWMWQQHSSQVLWCHRGLRCLRISICTKSADICWDLEVCNAECSLPARTRASVRVPGAILRPSNRRCSVHLSRSCSNPARPFMMYFLFAFYDPRSRSATCIAL